MLKSPTHNEMLKHLEKWREREATLSDFHDQIDMQSDFILDLCKDVPYNKTLPRAENCFMIWNTLDRKISARIGISNTHHQLLVQRRFLITPLGQTHLTIVLMHLLIKHLPNDQATRWR